jgi:uncharacterized protein with beta-barrel porin domain
MPHVHSTSTTRRALRIISCVLLIGLAGTTGVAAQALNTFAVLGGSSVTNTGVSTITGNVGLSPGTSATGTGDSGANRIDLTGTLHITDAVALSAKNELTAAFNVLMMTSASSVDLTGQTLGVGTAQTLTAGVYTFDSSAQLNGTLTLNGGPDDVFIFQIGSTLTTASSSAIVLGGTVKASNVFFVVGSSATLGTSTQFQGQILALASITLNTNTTIDCGAAWAENGQVTLQANTINVCTFAVAAGTFGDTLMGGGDVNQQAIIDAINAYITAQGSLPLAFSVLALLPPDQLAAALAELSGEGATGAAPAGNLAMDSLMDQIMAGDSGRTIVARETPPQSNTVSVMGYAEPSRIAPGSALDSVAMATAGRLPDINQWTIWGAGFGAQSSVQGDVAIGSHTVTTRDFGYTIGFERHVSADTLFGFAVSGGRTNFNLDDSLGSGHSAMLQAAAYAKSNIGKGYLSGILAYGAHDVVTDRYIDIGGAAHYHAEFVGQDVAAAVEAGYDMGWITPYVGLRMQGYLTPGYSEQTTAGSNVFALDYASHLDLSARTEVGLRVRASSDFDGGRLSAEGALAWAHSYAGGAAAMASFQVLPDSPSFEVMGAIPAADMLLASAGITADFDDGLSLGGTLGTNVAANAQTYRASVRLGYSY